MNTVTNMESRFPAMRVLWSGREFHRGKLRKECYRGKLRKEFYRGKLGKEFYRGKYGMTGSIQAWTPDIGDKYGYFDDEIWNLKGAGIFSISLLGKEIHFNVLDDSM
ncbi:hypothetical protein AVEN_200469-1 [Araneus ventricosus]|uniref:Uncharacterized protein n=1 Tax=Araneus ventricosus TaxID=182803 RepID=A0A4Y2LTZ1_ARAVE|nr:hypothetical protein AVEN_200469-1 [Araneus ventricosus]